MHTTSLFRRESTWRWWVCGLLLLATMINYMDRLTLNLLARHINSDLGLDKNDYASIEAGFALAFATGAILFGYLVDRWNVFWIYPLALIGWSAAGFFTGFAEGFVSLLACRVLLGLMESANWPCALRTTQHILPPSERSMGNSILQSGAAVGAILTPIIMFGLFDSAHPETWRKPFLVVGGVGMIWVFLWALIVRPADLTHPTDSLKAKISLPDALPMHLLIRRGAVLITLVITINMTWHFLRAWGPLYLQEKYGFGDDDTFWFFIAYYVFTDLGALAAGFLTLWLIRGGMQVHSSRRAIFFGFALLTGLCALVPYLPAQLPLTATYTLPGWVLIVAVLLVIGFGSLGVFPNYYSFTQDLTTRHQGKVTGALGCICWVAMALWQKAIGWMVEGTGSYAIPFLIAGMAPLVGFFALLLLWGTEEKPNNTTSQEAEDEHRSKELLSTPNNAIEGIVIQGRISQ